MTYDKHRPLVTAIIPTHNRPDLLIRAARSVAAQSYLDIEIIVVDDRSDYDVEAKIGKEVDSGAWRVVKNSRTAGAAGARNTGFEASRGVFIAFLDDDDEWLPDKIARQVEVLQKASDETGLVSSSYFVIEGGKTITKTRILEGFVFKMLCKEHVAGNTSIPLIRRDVFEAVGMFDENLAAAQDTDLWLRIAKRYHFATVEEPLAIIHRHDSERITTDFAKRIHGTYAFLLKHWPDLHHKRKYQLIKRIAALSLAVAVQKLQAIRP